MFKFFILVKMGPVIISLLGSRLTLWRLLQKHVLFTWMPFCFTVLAHLCSYDVIFNRIWWEIWRTAASSNYYKYMNHIILLFWTHIAKIILIITYEESTANDLAVLEMVKNMFTFYLNKPFCHLVHKWQFLIIWSKTS